ncbi:SMI1/KNR4 family protein [Corynebacterium cystitidis]|uniref:SMI1 / KNR4 family (SUKH-1) n=1 Tax=Corynebacterium cystitidis DSM 20524 TaxID=1121357 RepID=A0A1H9WL03_9CORY|nr:SMI1/KNR4 family protein [Corynebacterium cystitidis]WJY83416.1 SMI1 / KNR4 family protein [Corynebacterium cystitidis DSM 20524]SES34545.1 SMI1 / KNR4 family (SUKH-1) [Corynebacterium cystitidis DSM 20524]SNV61900.1 SMI1 / KNR4 family [Corynebacterium cystitidis]
MSVAKDGADLFWVVGEPASEERLDEINANLDVVLPDAMRQFISTYGGGHLDEKYSFIDGVSFAKGTSFEFVKTLYGNGRDETGRHDFNLDDEADYIARTWKLPAWGILIGLAEQEVHTPLLYNVSNPDFPVGSIVYVNLESDEQSVMADSAKEFYAAVVAATAPPIDLS